MAAITGSTSYEIAPNNGRKLISIKTPATADSADTIDLDDSTVTGGPTLSTVDWAIAWDITTGDAVTVTISGAVLTLDAAGGTTDKAYGILAVGQI